MAILTTNRLPKGSAGMTLLSSKNDDTLVSIPDIGFDFYYNGINCRTLFFVSGNSWAAFGSTTECLRINKKDTSCNKLLYSREIERDKPVFRIRWEGNMVFTSWGSNDILWELILYSDSTMVLVVEATTKNGADAFDTKGGDNTANWQAGKSYVLYPTQSQGKFYIIQEGSYYQTVKKYLMEDGENGIKSWLNNSWIKIADAPVTEAIIKSNGFERLPVSRNGLILTNPTLLMWTDDLNTPDCKVKTIALPKPKIIKQMKDYTISTGIESVVLTANVSGTAVIKVTCSIDGGTTWKALSNGSWINIDVSDNISIKANGMLPSTVNSVTETQWAAFVGTAHIIRFAYYMEQNAVTEICNIDHMRVNFK
jgi:hypothetical protein